MCLALLNCPLKKIYDGTVICISSQFSPEKKKVEKKKKFIVRFYFTLKKHLKSAWYKEFQEKRTTIIIFFLFKIFWLRTRLICILQSELLYSQYRNNSLGSNGNKQLTFFSVVGVWSSGWGQALWGRKCLESDIQVRIRSG